MPTNGNLFDEHVSKALARAKVAPIILPTPRLDEMSFVLKSGIGSLLVAGTAGDGKTFHCRNLWERLGGDKALWADKGSIKRLEYYGKEIVFVKDLSELGLGDADSQNILDGLERSVSGDDTVSYVIATNHGKILEHLRTRTELTGSVSPLRDPIQSIFLNPNVSHPRLKVIDLSKEANRSSMEDVLRTVAGHQEWYNCRGCVLNNEGKVCPITENRKRILGEMDGGLFAKRLGDLVELSRLNGAHLPIRDLLTMVTNALLGHPDAKEGLMTCADVARIQEKGTVYQASIYRNIFGANLKTKRAIAQPVFRILSVFGVGTETANGIDGLLVYGSDDSRLKESFNSLVANDIMYGASPSYLSAQRKYLEGGDGTSNDEGGNDFLNRLADQRRRLFFTLPNDAGLLYPNWGLTAFRNAGDYLTIVESLDGVRSPAAEKAKSVIVKGLNRVFTGLLLENTDKLFVSDGGGSARSKSSVLCQTEIMARGGSAGLSICKDTMTTNPCIEAIVVVGQPPVLFDLTPIRFEFLYRVAEGALPGSFSNECLEDLLAFKARILRLAEAERKKIAKENCGFVDSEVYLSFIEINDRNGSGSLEGITVRVQE
ncbi:hypothetical protein KKJ26_07030 [Xenorhabdus bovienii]|nr:hypothetical protein [Xenorhabdus bovienii]